MNNEEKTGLFVRRLHGELGPDEEELAQKLIAGSKEDARLYADLEEVLNSARFDDGTEATPGKVLTDRIMEKLSSEKITPRRRFLTSGQVFTGGIATLSILLITLTLMPEEIFSGLPNRKHAGGGGGAYSPSTSGRITYNDSKITNSTNAVLLYLEGSLGALFFLVAMLLAVVFLITWLNTRRKRHGYFALLFCWLGVFVFILRSLMSTFFNDRGISQ